MSRKKRSSEVDDLTETWVSDDEGEHDAIETLSSEFDKLLGNIPIADEGSKEREVAIDLINQLKGTFTKLKQSVKREESTTLERSGSDLPESGGAEAVCAKSGKTEDLLTKAFVKFSEALELLRKPGDRSGLQNSASGYGGSAGRAMQVLVKSMDLKKWKGEESEPWENVEARVVDAAEAVGCEEALDYDYEDLLAEDKDAYAPETIAEWKEKNEAAMYILKKIFSAKGKAFNIVNKHKKKTGRDTWAYAVWSELKLGFNAEGVHDRTELQAGYREACKFKEKVNPVDQITDVETWVYKLRQCGSKIDTTTIIYDILGGLPDCYKDLGQDIEEMMEDAAENGGPPVTLAKVERILKKRWQWTRKQKPEAEKLKKKIADMKKQRSPRGGRPGSKDGGKSESKDKANKASKKVGGGKSCYCCGSEDHLIADCDDKKKLKKLAEAKKASRECYCCGKKGHVAADCPILADTDGEEEEEVKAKPAKKKALKAKDETGSRGGTKLKPSSKVELLDTEEENEGSSESADEYIVSNPGSVSKVNAVRVLQRKQLSSDGISSAGDIIELVLDSGATSPISPDEKELINYRRAKKKHEVEVADGVRYKVKGYGTWAGFVKVSKRKKVWVEITDNLHVPEMKERLLASKQRHQKEWW